MTDRPAAACTQHPPEWWTAEPTKQLNAADVREMHEAAARICSTCPVRRQCSDQAETERQDGNGQFNLPRPFGVLWATNKPAWTDTHTQAAKARVLALKEAA